MPSLGDRMNALGGIVMWVVSATRIDVSLGGPCFWREFFNSEEDAHLYVNQHKSIYPDWDFLIWFIQN